MMRDGLRLLLEQATGVEVVGSCGDCATAWRTISELRPDLVLMDVDLPDGSGIALTQRVRGAFPEVKILVLTAHFELNFAVEAIDAGAHGFLVKSQASAELLAAVRTIREGRIHLDAGTSAALAQGRPQETQAAAERVRQVLPAREAQVLGMLLRGLRNKEIAAELSLSVKTVETYRSRLMKRFGCASLAELVRHAIRVGLTVA